MVLISQSTPGFLVSAPQTSHPTTHPSLPPLPPHPGTALNISPFPLHPPPRLSVQLHDAGALINLRSLCQRLAKVKADLGCFRYQPRVSQHGSSLHLMRSDPMRAIETPRESRPTPACAPCCYQQFSGMPKRTEHPFTFPFSSNEVLRFSHTITSYVAFAL